MADLWGVIRRSLQNWGLPMRQSWSASAEPCGAGLKPRREHRLACHEQISAAQCPRRKHRHHGNHEGFRPGRAPLESSGAVPKSHGVYRHALKRRNSRERSCCDRRVVDEPIRASVHFYLRANPIAIYRPIPTDQG